MASWTVTIGAPGRDSTGQQTWSPFETPAIPTGLLVDPALVDGGGAAYLKYLQFQRFGIVDARFNIVDSGQGIEAGPDLVPAFETGGTITLAAGGVSVVFNVADDQSPDTAEPYVWSLASGSPDLTAYQAQWDAYRALTDKTGTTLTLDDNATPDAEAPTVAIDAIADGDEGTTVQLSATVADGTYDELDYAWTVSGGTLNDDTAESPTWTRPAVTADTDYDINLTATARGTGTNAADGTSDAVTAATRSATVRNDPVVTTDTDSVWRLGDQDTTPATPTGGTGTESHTPSGWTRAEPDPTDTQAVYRSQRIRTFTDGTFTSAAAWGDPARIADRNMVVGDFTVPAGRAADFVCLIEVDGTGNIYWVSGGNGTILSGDLALDDADIEFNRVQLVAAGFRLVRSGAGSVATEFASGAAYETANVHVQTGLTDVFALENADANRTRAQDIRYDVTTAERAAIADQVDGDRIIVALTRAEAVEPTDRDASVTVTAGVPAVAASAESAAPINRDASVEITAGDPTVAVQASRVATVDRDATVTITAGSPTVRASAEIGDITNRDASATITAGDPTVSVSASGDAIQNRDAAATITAGLPTVSVSAATSTGEGASDAFRRAAFAHETGDVWLALLTISHPSLSDDIRAVNDYEDITSNGDLYTKMPFEFTLPEQAKRGTPRWKLEISNVSREIHKNLKAIEDNVGADIRIIRSDTPDIIEASFLGFILQDTDTDVLNVSGTLGLKDLRQESLCQYRMTPANFPGIFA